MKKILLLSLFGTIFNSYAAHINENSLRVEVIADVVSSTQLIITDSTDSNLHKSVVSLNHGTISNNASNQSNLLKTSNPLYIKRSGGDSIYVNNLRKITLSFEDENGNYVLRNGTGSDAGIITGNLSTVQESSVLPNSVYGFTIKSELNKSSLMDAPVGSYVGSTVLNVIIE